MKLSPLGKHDNFVAIPHRQLVARIKTIPLDHSVKVRFYNLFRKWSDSSSPLWAVDRTKALRDCIMQSRAHGGLISKPAWVASTKAGNLRGIYGSIYRIAMASYKGFRAILNLLNILTVWKQRSMDTVTRDGIHTEICQPPVVRSKVGSPGSKQLRKLQAIWLTKGRAFNNQTGLKGPTRVQCKRATPLAQVLPGKQSHVAQLGSDLTEMRNHMTYIQHPEPVRQAMGGWLMEINQSIAWTLWAQKASIDGWSDSDIKELRDQPGLITKVEANSGNLKKDLVGRVNYTFEPGLKTRFFAAPNVVLQRALEPLKDGIFKVLKRLPWDCTHSQHKADDLIIGHMQRGKTCHTIDMSKATDNFPWEYQKTVLNMVMNTRDSYTRELVGLLTTIVERGQWHLDSGRNLRRCRWKKGQPLGLGPSFPLFALTHGLVLLSLNEGRWDSTFFVLGDDVIILDDHLAIRYKKWLSVVGVTISEQKTFSSNTVGQFAGKTYTPYGAFWVPKWVEFTKDNVIDVCAWWYPGLSEVFPKDRKTIDRVLSLPSPLGNGWNPTGLSLDDRLDPHVINSMLERDERRKAKAIPSSSDCRLTTIVKALRLSGFNDTSSYDACGLTVEKQRATSYTTSVTTSVPQALYAPETEVPGSPSIRFHGAKVDPYSKGKLSMWKHIFQSQPQSQD
jgi:hypothetical protein